MTGPLIQHGDFTLLAEDYSRYRPAYAPLVLDTVLGMARGAGPRDISGADVGAGTGIWTRMLARDGCRMTAVEPNDEMRSRGEAANDGLPIEWRRGSAEETGLADASFDLVSMASSLHWTDFSRATAEFRRILKPTGVFVALWNTRVPEASPLLARIERRLKEIVPDLTRVSSGRSPFCDTLFDRLRVPGGFDEVVYVEGQHVEQQSPERYLGLWRSSNDVRAQAGPERFDSFMRAIEDMIQNERAIEATYLTRAWIARRVAARA